MRPLNHTGTTPTITLDELAARLRAERVLLLATLPSGDLRVVRAGRGTGGSWTAAMSRQYLAAGQFTDAASWNAILEREPTDDAATQDEVAGTIAARLEGPLLAGYPGALVAIAGADREPFDEADQAVLDEAAERIAADPSFTVPCRLGDCGKITGRLFIIDESGSFLTTRPTAAGLDPTLAGHVEAYARTRVADATPATGGERVLLPNATGQMHVFTIALHARHGTLSGGRVLFVMQVPHFTEWLELRPADFAADQEIGRLLPAFAFMKDRYQDGVTLPAIAKHVSLSPFHFHRRFTELLGITPKHFLYDAQIARAQEYLLASTHELEQVAKLCGFAHQSHFTSRFKQATGLTPTRWRRLKLAGDRAAVRVPERV